MCSLDAACRVEEIETPKPSTGYLLADGAGFIVAIVGNSMTMQGGLPKQPAAERIDIDGRITEFVLGDE